MIRHKPLGSGHPYAQDTDQRTPVLPIAGELLRIGAKASAATTSVTVLLEERLSNGTTRQHRLDASQVVRTSRGQAIDGGHLASAQAKLARQSGGWEAAITLDLQATHVSYRIEALSKGKTSQTRTFSTDVARWLSAPDGLVEVTGDSDIAVTPGSVRALVTAQYVARVTWEFALAPNEKVAGFGERFDALNQRGTSLDVVVFEQYKSQGAMRRTYLPMPFAHVVGGTGWGFHIETSRRVWCDVGESNADALIVSVDTALPIAAQTLADATPAVKVNIFTGTPTQVLAGFLDVVGHPEELPAWTLRLWASGNEWNTQAEVERQVALHQEHGIALGALVIEAWSDEATFTAWRDAKYTPREDGGPLRLEDFTFPRDGAWPDPKGMTERLHDQDIRLLLWQIPLMKMRPHPKGQARHDADALVREELVIRERDSSGKLRPYRNRGWWFPLALMPDLTDPKAALWWTEKRRYLVEEIGIDGFKTDGGEHAWGSDLEYWDGSGGATQNNLYPAAYAKAYGDLMRRCGKAPVTFSRAGYAGSQSHGAFWAGDENSTWQAFTWSMWAGLNAAACGIVYWGWDIAGFSGPVPEPELYVRAFAASAFVPIMQYHSEFNHHRKPSRDRTPWNIAQTWDEPQVIDEIRDIVALRERLLPYLEQQARKAVNNSCPLMRPLFFEYPGDHHVWQTQPQWLLGDDILVAPVLAPGSDWKVYLPEGQWRDAWTGAQVSGSRWLSTSTPRHRVPVFVKEEAWAGLRDVFTPTS